VPVSEQYAELFVFRLDKAVKNVCYPAAATMIGLTHDIYLECIKATRRRSRRMFRRAFTL
jgi:hypothetical protein